MAADDDENGHRPDRLWRVEQRQTEIISREERIQARLDEIVQRNWRADETLATISKHLDELVKRPTTSGLFVEPSLVKMVVLGFIALAGAAVTGKLLIFDG